MKKSRILIPLIILVLLVSCRQESGYPPPQTSVPLDRPPSSVANTAPGLKPPAHPIALPEGFQINIYTENLLEPRMMAVGPDQALYITEFSSGRVLRLPDRDGNGEADQVEVVAEGFIEPSGLAFYEDGSLYVAETTRVFRLSNPDEGGKFQDREIIISGIPAGGNTNRTIIFSPDWRRLFLSVGSSCNACIEQDPRRATIMLIKPDGSDSQIYAKGFRNIIGLAFHPEDETLWGAAIGREGLTADLPPEIIYTIYLDTDGGWPYCHAGEIIDPDYGDKESCSDDILKPRFTLEAHTAPHGLEFYLGSQFPDQYHTNLFIALHGTSEGNSAAGYKIIRKPLGAEGRIQDFAVGWLLDDGSFWGTPMDLIEGPDGSLFLSDNFAGIIYRISYGGK